MNLLNCLHNVTFLNSGMLLYLVPCCQPWPLGCTNQFAKSSPQKEEHRWAASWACNRLCQERGVLRHQPQGEGCLPGPWPTRAGHTGGGECRHLGRQIPNLFGCIFFYFFSIYWICCSHISLILSVKGVEKLCWNTWDILQNLFRLFLENESASGNRLTHLDSSMFMFTRSQITFTLLIECLWDWKFCCAWSFICCWKNRIKCPWGESVHAAQPKVSKSDWQWRCWRGCAFDCVESWSRGLNGILMWYPVEPFFSRKNILLVSTASVINY